MKTLFVVTLILLGTQLVAPTRPLVTMRAHRVLEAPECLYQNRVLVANAPARCARFQ